MSHEARTPTERYRQTRSLVGPRSSSGCRPSGLQPDDLHAWRSGSGVSKAEKTGGAKALCKPVPPTDVSQLYSLWRRLAPKSGRVLE